MDAIVYQIIIVVLVILLMKPKCSEGLIEKPSNSTVSQYTRDVAQNRDLFTNGTFYAARDKLAWLDPIAFEQLRMLSKNNNLTDASVRKVFA